MDETAGPQRSVGEGGFVMGGASAMRSKERDASGVLWLLVGLSWLIGLSAVLFLLA